MKDSFNELEYWKKQLREGIHGRDTKLYIMRELIAAANRRGIIVPGENTPEFTQFMQEVHNIPE